jgi:hypothetical protein
VQNATNDIKEYLLEEFAEVIINEDFEEGLYAHLAGGYGGIDANYIRVKLENAFGIQ